MSREEKLILPIRLYIRTARVLSSARQLTNGEIVAQLPSFMAPARTVDPNEVPGHVELIAYFKGSSNLLRCIVVYGPLEHIGCFYTSTSGAGTCTRGYAVTNNVVFYDQDMTQSLTQIHDRLENNPDLAQYKDLEQYIMPNHQFRSVFLHSDFRCTDSDPVTVTHEQRHGHLDKRYPYMRLPLDLTSKLASFLMNHEMGLCSACFGCTNDDEANVVCCDFCNREFHFKCLKPPIQSLEELPAGDWHCGKCIAPARTQANFPIPALKKRKVLEDPHSFPRGRGVAKRLAKVVPISHKPDILIKSVAEQESIGLAVEQLLKLHTSQRQVEKRPEPEERKCDTLFVPAHLPFWWSQSLPFTVEATAVLQPAKWDAPFLNMPAPSHLATQCMCLIENVVNASTESIRIFTQFIANFTLFACF